MPTDILLQLLLALSALRFVQAANDWSQPCFSGTCSYDLPITDNGPSGTLQIWGAEHAIADITPASGWEILSCDPESSAQDIRLVCRDGANSDGCAHLWNTPETAMSANATEQSAVGKIVRLPENCGTSAFARIADAWVSDDQSIPPAISRQLIRIDGEGVTGRSLRIDTNFSTRNTGQAKYGPIRFAIVAANVPGATAKGDVNVSTSDIELGIVSSLEARSSMTRLTRQRRFEIDISSDLKMLPPLNFSTSISLVREQCTLPIGGLSSSNVGVNGGLSADLNTDFHAEVALGVVARGDSSSGVQEFGLTSIFSAGLANTLTLHAGGVGRTTEKKSLLEKPLTLPGVPFGRIFDIGLSLSVDAQVDAELDLNVDMLAGINYQIQQAKFTFPKGDNSQAGSFERSDTPVRLTTQSSGGATGTVTVHLIPKISFDVKVHFLDVSTSIFATLDASATAKLETGATGPALTRTKLPRAKLPAVITTPAGQLQTREAHIRGRNLIGESYFSPSKSALHVMRAFADDTGRNGLNATNSTKHSGQAEVGSLTEAKQEARAVETDGGCIDMSAKLDINVGATANLFDLFDPSTSVNVFTKELPLLQTCPSGITQVRKRSEPKADVTVLHKRALQCIDQNSLGGLVPLADYTVPGTNLRA